MKWHHYAGLLFGVLTITWVFSGLVSLDVIPGIRESRYSPQQIAEGARSVQGEGAILELDTVTVDSLRAAAARCLARSRPKSSNSCSSVASRTSLRIGRPRPPRSTSGAAAAAWTSLHQRLTANTCSSPLFSRTASSRASTMTTVMGVARDAMPGVTIRDATWLADYDDYYYKTVSSFDSGLPRMARTLPVLRVRYEDAAQTWLYLTPTPGQILKVERQDRANRWGYYGLHGLDFAFLYRHRPLWDIVVVALLIGVGVSSITSLVPAYRRLARHARKLALPALRSSRRPVSTINQES